jgi:hypothetical protein
VSFPVGFLAVTATVSVKVQFCGKVLLVQDQSACHGVRDGLVA